MKALLRILAGIAGILVFAYIVGLLIPREHVATRSAQFARAPEVVWQLLADFPGYTAWAPEVKGIKRLPDQNGHAVWSLEGDWGMPLEVESAEPPRRMVTRIADPQLPFGGTWTWEVAAAGQGTRITVTENGFIKPPLFRVLTRFFFGYHSTMDTYLKAIGRHFGETTTPGPAVIPGAER